MEALADIADAYSFAEVRTTHRQNMVMADVEEGELLTVWKRLAAASLATPNIGTVTDMICCPGLDFCSLANASSISIADDLNQTFDQLDYVYDLGPLELKMSGCINACGHHHVGHIGILGISKSGEEYYQIMLGGSAGDDSSLGKWLGPAIPKPDIASAVGRMLERFVSVRDDGERFLDTYRRLGSGEFKEAVYG
jgi:sulfite reductase (NADPH) hemoprotein beta-component